MSDNGQMGTEAQTTGQRRYKSGFETPTGERARGQGSEYWVRCSLSVSLLSMVLACNHGPGVTTSEGPANRGPDPSAVDVEKIIGRCFRKSTSSGDVTSKIKVNIQEPDGSSREVRLTTHHRREPDGRQLMLIEFTAPAQERDRSALVTISARGEIEATRYAQSNNSFVSTTGVTSEDSLFGMSLQELAEGQPEKYDFSHVGEESFKSAAVYRMEGKLKEGEESRFSRVVLLVSKERFAMVAAEFYDKQKNLARRMEVLAFEKTGDSPERTHWTVENLARQKKLDFEALSVAHNQHLSDSIFTRERLKKLASR